jgi:hypothetical protein
MPDSLILEAVRLEIINQKNYHVLVSADREPDLRENLFVAQFGQGVDRPTLFYQDSLEDIPECPVGYLYDTPCTPVWLENMEDRWTIMVTYDKKETIFFQYHRKAELMPGSAVIRILAFQFLLALMNFYFHLEDEEQKPSWFFGEWKHTMDEG